MKNSLVPDGVQHLADYIEDKLIRYADLPAYSALGQTFSFAEIDEKSKALAAWLQHHTDLQAGDRIAIQLPNLLQNPIAVYAALRAGLVVVNTNPLYTPSEMAHQFSDSGAKAIIILDDMLPKLTQIQDKTDIQVVITAGATDFLMPNKINRHENTHNLIDVIDAGSTETLLARPQNKLSDICMLQYTGGTTGVSKGAALSHENVLCNSVQTLDRLGTNFVEGQEVVICPLPLYHIYAFTVCMMTLFAKGSLNVLIPNPRDLDAFVDQLKPFKMTAFAGINTLFVGLSAHPEFQKLDFSQLRLTMSGGTALTESAVKVWQKTTGCAITEGYGLSETSPVVCFNQPGKEELGTVGQPLLDTEVQLFDESDKAVEEGQAGQIAVKGPQVMLGYWQRPEETAKVMSDCGHFKTGDIGIRMPSGTIKIVDRLKDMIIVSGFNVYPNEVENALTQHPKVAEAAVIGKPDDKTGERVCAYITVSSAIEEDELNAFCRELLTAYKVPKEIHILDELPKSSVGKLLRRKLRAQ